jgi:hypothetical protein
MRIALLVPLVVCIFIASASASDTEPIPGRDGSYQFETFNLEGTVWEGRLIPEANMLVRFERGGVLWYRYAENGGSGSRTGSWKQTGTTVYLETNKKYAEYNAVIRGDRMIGDAHNIRPFQWTWELKRRPTSAAPKDDNVVGNGPKRGKIEDEK